MIVQANDVAGVRRLCMLPVGGHEGYCLRQLDRLAQPQVHDAHALAIPARTDTHERYPVSMSGVHVRLDLEHKTGEAIFHGFDGAAVTGARQRRRRHLDKLVEQLPDPEVRERGAEEHGRLPGGPVFVPDRTPGTHL